MLKIKRRLFLGLVVLAGSACVTPTHVSSALSQAPPVVITQIQAGSLTSARSEYIVLYNNSADNINLQSWSITNKSNKSVATIAQPQSAQAILPGYNSAVIASSDYVKESPLTVENFAVIYDVNNQSSGSITGSTDTITLSDSQGLVVDKYSWTTSLAGGKIAQRSLLSSNPRQYINTGAASDWSIESKADIPQNSLLFEYPEPSVVPPIKLQDPYLTELLANPKGADSGKEFVEFYNPNSEPLSLGGYELRMGANLENSVIFSDTVIIPPLGYLALYNNDFQFSLLNSTNNLQLYNLGLAVGDYVSYVSPKEDKSWSLADDGTWAYTSFQTPSAANIMSEDQVTAPVDAPEEVVPAALKPCASNQYRSAETNRCRLIETATSSSLAACKEGQERNPDTNRCRAIAQSAEVVACKEGQERNPDTGRCRAIKVMTTAGYAVDPKAVAAAKTGVSWYYWAAIGVVILVIVAYAVWEWHTELQKIFAHAVLWFKRPRRSRH